MTIGTFTKANKEIEVNYVEKTDKVEVFLTIMIPASTIIYPPKNDNGEWPLTERVFANQVSTGYAFRLNKGSKIAKVLGANNSKPTFLLTDLAKAVDDKISVWAYEKARKEGAVFFE